MWLPQVDQIRPPKSHCNFPYTSGLMLAYAVEQMSDLDHRDGRERTSEWENIGGETQVVRLYPVFSATLLSGPID